MSTQSLILDYSKLEKTKLNLINKGTLSPFKNKIKYKFYNIHLKKIKELKKINEKKQIMLYYYTGRITILQRI